MSANLVPLIRKDWRLFRAPVLAILLLGGLGYFVRFIMYEIDRRSVYNVPRSISDYFSGAAAFGLWTIAAMAAVYGGSAFASERRERWGDFLNLLPPGRGLTIVSKLLVAVTCMLVGAVVHASVIKWLAPERWAFVSEDVAVWAAATFMLFGVAWFCSTWLSSAAISASVAIALTIGVGVIISMCADTYRWIHAWSIYIFCVSAAIIGGVCLLAGTVYYLRRVEP